MPSLVMRPGNDPLKRYWWAVFGLVLAAGGGAILTLAQRQGGLSGGRPAADEQSLDSIAGAGAAPGAAGLQAPGNPLDMPSEGAGGAYAGKPKDLSSPESMLYQPAFGPASSGAPIAASEAQALKDGKLAEALSRVAHAGRKPDGKGWGGEAPRTGFSVPRANFGALSGLGGAGGGGGQSGAGYSAPVSAFSAGPGGAAGRPSIGAGGPGGDLKSAVKEGKNQNLNFLKQAEALASKAAMAVKADAAAGLAGRSFDASAARPGLGGSAGGGAAGGIGEGVPDNLKANDPKLQRRDLTPPKPPEPSKLKSKEELEQEAEQKLEEMLISAAVGGILGPIFGGVGAGLAGAFGLPASSGGSYGGYSSTYMRDAQGRELYIKNQ